MGSSLFSFRMIDAMRKAIENIKARNGTVSFDPNIRKEMLNIPEMSQAFEYILDYTDIFLPSDGELDYFGLNPGRDEQVLVDKLLKRGVKHVVIKRGRAERAISAPGKRIMLPVFMSRSWTQRELATASARPLSACSCPAHRRRH
jgi:sugar/nucleoside kinase (ribokinase family)